jgi:hypothetical protein
MNAVGLARGQRLSGAQGPFKIEREGRRRRFRRVRNSRDWSVGRNQDDARLAALALDLREHGIGPGAGRKADANIEPLRNRSRKAPASDRRDLEAVDGDEFAIERAKPDVKGAHRRAVDDPQKHPSARLDLDDLRVGQRTEIGEEGVIFDVVQVGPRLAKRHRRRHLHARRRSHGAGRLRHAPHLGVGHLRH